MAKILIVAGEASGDRLGAMMLKELKKITSRHSFMGVGSSCLESEGMELLARSEEVDVIGSLEGLSRLPKLYLLYLRLKELIIGKEVDTLLLIDYPGMNLRLAHIGHRAGLPVIYYVSPQIWAWRPGRIKKIKRSVNRMLVILPFEVEIYKKAGVPVSYVGHPLVDRVQSRLNLNKEELRRKFSIGNEETLIAFLPGSRKQEVGYMLPEMVRAAILLVRHIPKVRFVIPVAPSLNEEFLMRRWSGLVGNEKVESILVKDDALEMLAASNVAVVASGTASLEAALLHVPQIVVYKVNPITYQIGKRLVKVRWLSLVNNILGEEVVPELVQHDMKAELIAEKVREMLSHKGQEMVEKMKELRKVLGPPGASERAALEVEGLLRGKGL